MPEVRLDACDAAERAEMLQFLAGWLGQAPTRLAASLAQFAGHPAYGDELQDHPKPPYSPSVVPSCG